MLKMFLTFRQFLTPADYGYLSVSVGQVYSSTLNHVGKKVAGYGNDRKIVPCNGSSTTTADK
jgi:hypothetical protein